MSTLLEDVNNQKLEEFVRWFLRLNGYFGIENFIVHAADDPERISDGVVAPHTETDTLAVRMPYSQEIAGNLRIANYPPLVTGASGKFDVVIAEAKSGNENKPNKVWTGKEAPVEYIVRFIGLNQSEEHIKRASSGLLSNYSWEDERARYRYIIFSEKPNEHYQSKGLTYLTYAEIIRFLVEIRGSCWVEANIGVASVHYQWNPTIRLVFDIANSTDRSIQERCEQIMKLINGS